jgi:hypothetical protein
MLVPALSAMDLGMTDRVVIGDPSRVSDNEVVVPIEVLHDEDLVAMDIPLEYSDGVVLTDVSFDDTRVAYFDVKLSNIDEASNRVVIGLINMVYEHKPALAAKTSLGQESAVAYLTFRVDDLTLEQFEISAFTMEEPSHKLTLIYNDFTSGAPEVKTINPDLEGGVVNLGSVLRVVPENYSLVQNFPNPFNPTTEIAYDLPEAANVNLEVYNILGQNVKSLVNQYQDAGSYRVTWNGTNNEGAQVASGVYFYRISAGDFKDIKKMVLMK